MAKPTIEPENRTVCLDTGGRIEIKIITPLLIASFMIIFGLAQILNGLIGGGVVMIISAFFILYLRNKLLKCVRE